MSTLDYLDQIKQTLQAKGAPGGWLNSPAPPQAIKAAEEEMGYDLPDDWRQLYAQHNGESGHLGLFLDLPWLPLEEVLVQWRTWKGLEADYAQEGTHFSVPSGVIRERYVNLGWIPLSHDWGGNHLGVDMAPGVNGVVGQFINFGRDEELKFVLAQNTADLFRFLAEEIASERCQVEDPTEAMSWCDGQNLMGEMRRMPLPVYQPQRSVQRPAGDLSAWKSALPGPWPQVISSPEAFLASRVQYLIRKGLTELEPLRWCQGLVGLYIARNEVKDLGPLAGLPDLQLIQGFTIRTPSRTVT